MLEQHFRSIEFPDGERPGGGQWGEGCPVLSPPAAPRALMGIGKALPGWSFLSVWVRGEQ